MAQQTELQARVAAILAEERAAAEERQAELDAVNAAGEKRLAAKDAEKERIEAANRAALAERQAARKRAEHDRLRVHYRAQFPGDDQQFAAAWPGILERLTAAAPQRRVTPL